MAEIAEFIEGAAVSVALGHVTIDEAVRSVKADGYSGSEKALRERLAVRIAELNSELD